MRKVRIYSDRWFDSADGVASALSQVANASVVQTKVVDGKTMSKLQAWVEVEVPTTFKELAKLPETTERMLIGYDADGKSIKDDIDVRVGHYLAASRLDVQQTMWDNVTTSGGISAVAACTLVMGILADANSRDRQIEVEGRGLMTAGQAYALDANDKKVPNIRAFAAAWMAAAKK